MSKRNKKAASAPLREMSVLFLLTRFIDGIDVLEMKEKEACFLRRIAHSLAVMIECAAIGRVLTHLSSASDVVRTFDVRLTMKIVR